MTKKQSGEPKTDHVEGEGSYSGALRYSEQVKKHAQNADTEQLGKDAKRALEGDEKEELEAAERRGKRGPSAA